MSALSDLLVIGAVGVGAYYLYTNYKPAKTAADAAISTVGATIDLAGNPNRDAVKDRLKKNNTTVAEDLGVPSLPDPVIDTIVDLKGTSVLPTAGVPLITKTLTDAVAPAVDRELDKGVDGIAMDYLNATNPVKQLTNLGGEVAGLIDDVINGRWKWTGLHF